MSRKHLLVPILIVSLLAEGGRSIDKDTWQTIKKYYSMLKSQKWLYDQFVNVSNLKKISKGFSHKDCLGPSLDFYGKLDFDIFNMLNGF